MEFRFVNQLLAAQSGTKDQFLAQYFISVTIAYTPVFISLSIQKLYHAYKTELFLFLFIIKKLTDFYHKTINAHLLYIYL